MSDNSVFIGSLLYHEKGQQSAWRKAVMTAI